MYLRSTGRTVVMYSKSFGQGLIALAAFLSSCCSPSSEDRYALPEFDNVSDAKVEIISEELFGINRVSDIFVMEDHVVVGAYNAEDNTVLQVFDREGAELCHAVQYGRGPKEVLSILNLWSDKGKGVVGIVDQNQNKEVYVDIDRLLEEGPVSITEEGGDSALMVPGDETGTGDRQKGRHKEHQSDKRYGRVLPDNGGRLDRQHYRPKPQLSSAGPGQMFHHL